MDHNHKFLKAASAWHPTGKMDNAVRFEISLALLTPKFLMANALRPTHLFFGTCQRPSRCLINARNSLPPLDWSSQVCFDPQELAGLQEELPESVIVLNSRTC